MTFFVTEKENKYRVCRYCMYSGPRKIACFDENSPAPKLIEDSSGLCSCYANPEPVTVHSDRQGCRFHKISEARLAGEGKNEEVR